MKKVIDVNAADWKTAVIQQSHTIPVVIDFWAAWCGPCRMLGPILEKIANEPNSGFVLAKLDTDQNQQIAMQYSIQGIPAVKAFVNGRVVKEFVGALPESQVRAFIQQLPKAAGKSTGKPTAKKPASQAIGSPDDRLKAARALLSQGKGCSAKIQLDGLTDPAAVKLMPFAAFLCSMGKGGSNDDLSIAYEQVARSMNKADYASGLYKMLTILNQDKGYRNGEAYKAMMGLFELLGSDHELTRAYMPLVA